MPRSGCDRKKRRKDHLCLFVCMHVCMVPENTGKDGDGEVGTGSGFQGKE